MGIVLTALWVIDGALIFGASLSGMPAWAGWFVHYPILAAITPAAALVLVLCPVSIWWQIERRQPFGHCVCGYDLRASRERCPECGKSVK